MLCGNMADSQDDLLKQISVLKMKISGRLKLSHGEDVTTYIFSVFQGQMMEYVTEIKICMSKLDSFPHLRASGR